jgi:hypothetical protein
VETIVRAFDVNGNGDELWSKVVAVVTDGVSRWLDSTMHLTIATGASNVRSAAGLILQSRRCFVHAVQLVIKHFLAGLPDLADLTACVSFFARLSHVSGRFRNAVGNIPTGSFIRWGSYLKVYTAVYEKRGVLRAFLQRLNLDQGKNAKLIARYEPRFNMLVDGGLKMCYNVVLLLERIERLTQIGQGGRITASRVIPEVVAMRAHVRDLFAGESDVKLTALPAGVLPVWQERLRALTRHYLDPFMRDEVFLAAMILDPSVDLSQVCVCILFSHMQY